MLALGKEFNSILALSNISGCRVVFLDNIQAETNKHINIIYFTHKGEVRQTDAAEIMVVLMNEEKSSEKN